MKDKPLAFNVYNPACAYRKTNSINNSDNLKLTIGLEGIKYLKAKESKSCIRELVQGAILNLWQMSWCQSQRKDSSKCKWEKIYEVL